MRTAGIWSSIKSIMWIRQIILAQADRAFAKEALSFQPHPQCSMGQNNRLPKHAALKLARQMCCMVLLLPRQHCTCGPLPAPPLTQRVYT